MENIIIEGSNKTPHIAFDSVSGILELSGKSIPENSFAFYQPLLVWLDNYIVQPAATTVVKVQLEYFNTSSSKCLLDIFRKLEILRTSQKSTVKVAWYYEEEDEDMQEAGQDYDSLVDVPFEIIQL